MGWNSSTIIETRVLSFRDVSELPFTPRDNIIGVMGLSLLLLASLRDNEIEGVHVKSRTESLCSRVGICERYAQARTKRFSSMS